MSCVNVATTIRDLILHDKIRKGHWEVVIPCLTSSWFIAEYEVVVDAPYASTLIQNGDKLFMAVDFKGRKVHVLGDFYNFNGDKNNQADVRAHFNTYVHGLCEVGPVRCAYHIRKIHDNNYIKNKMKQWQS